MAVVPAINTPVTPPQLFEAYGRAWITVFAADPVRATILVLCAQTWQETGGTHVYNHNLGNTKAHGELDSMVLRTREVVGGQDVMMNCHFAAFPSLEAGAAEQIAFLAGHYPTCLDAAVNADPARFAIEAKQHGYFSGELPAYTVGMVSAYNHFATTIPMSMWEIEVQAANAPRPAEETQVPAGDFDTTGRT